MTATTAQEQHDLQFPGGARSTDLGFLNLTFLMALREAAARDLTRACYQYGLSKAELDDFARLSVESIQAIARRMDQSMMTLRFSIGDLRELAHMPSGMAVLIAPNLAH